MPIFSQGSGDVGQSVLDPDWNTLAAMDFNYTWFVEDESFFNLVTAGRSTVLLTRS